MKSLRKVGKRENGDIGHAYCRSVDALVEIATESQNVLEADIFRASFGRSLKFAE